jgi:hypothetical protein
VLMILLSEQLFGQVGIIRIPPPLPPPLPLPVP